MTRAHDASRPATLVAGVMLVLATIAAWSNSFAGPFVFDDRPAILANPTLTSFTAALSPPRDGGTVAGRPLINLSLALNHAISGTDVGSYHALNVAIHLAAGLTLFGLIRRTLTLSGSTLPATWFAFSAALLWLLHPLQTAAVTYVIQRAESLTTLCLLLTLFAFVRAAERDRSSQSLFARRWMILSVVFCLVGMAGKEVMVVTPLIVLLYDRTFAAGSFATALRLRWGYYTALAATWILLAWLVASNAGRAGTAGFTTKIGPFDYLLTQCGAIVRYLALAVWPRPLVFDYGTSVVTAFSAVWPQALLLLALVAFTIAALRRAPAVGFLSAVFFLLLAPSSSIVPIATQTIAEHRMYLPLAVITTGVMFGLYSLLNRFAVFAAVGLAVALGIATAQRNQIYRDSLTLWRDTAAKRPENPRAQNHAGIALAQAGRPGEAIPHYEAALRSAPDDAEVHNNLANALTETGHAAEALGHYETSVRLKPSSQAAQINLANALTQAGRTADALAHYAAAERLGSLDASALSSFGAALASTGQSAEAIACYERALQLDPKHAPAHYNLGLALARTRQFAPAIDRFRTAVQLEPGNVAARVNLGNVLLLAGNAVEAIAEYEAALRLRPDDPQIRANLARARALRR
jgi:protein O-mannosyl-transferase